MSSREQVDAEPRGLPSTLSILPLKDRILLPSSAMKLVLTTPSALALVDDILGAAYVKPGTLYVGVVPVRRDAPPSAGGVTSGASQLDAESFDAEDDADDVRAHLHDVGTAARIIQIARGDRPGMKSYTLLLEGRCRFELNQLSSTSPFLVAHVRQLDSLSTSPFRDLGGNGRDDGVTADDGELGDMAASFKENARALVDKLEHRKGAARRLKSMLEQAPPHRLADLFVAAFEDSFDARLELLSTTCPKERMRRALALVEAQLHAATVNADVTKKVEGRLTKTQREYLLRQQMAAIREELGEGEDAGEEDDLEKLRAKLLDAAPPAEVLKTAEAELRKLRKMTEQAPAYGVTRGWIETVASLPWSKEAAADVTVEASSMADARAVLDEEHYGLDRVKDRIIEYLAVRRLRPDARPPILCFQGPPGVGKTTLARSIAKVLQRPFQRISLGGVRDEADVRGHRRTYIASMPGRLIQGLKRVGVRDPVMLLDELDKMGSDSRGDPAAAMLEVLDPEQNHAFTDHYMGVPFDLSRITFLATANDPRTIPGPLRDRMEMITVPGYTDEEKLAIACRHVVPKVLEEHGLLHAGREGNNRDANTPRLRIPRDAVELVVRSYTREAGVRGLQRCLESLCRAVAVSVAHESDAAAAGSANGDGGSSPPAALQGTHVIPRGADGVPEVTTELVRAVLGPARFDSNNDDLKDHHGDIPGVVAGLSWTAVGGDLMYIEAAVMPGGGTLQLTGQLGDVIKESALIAMSWVQSHAHALRLRAPGGGGGGGGAREFFDDGAAGGKGGLGRASPGDVYAASENDADAAAAAAAAAFDASQHGAGGKAESSATIKTHLAGDGLLRGRSVHVHLPQGAIPKDGPSAGVTMCTALVSLFSDRPARSDTAMTGEVSLRGLVLPVGGVKEKLIAAHQNGIRRVLIPARNVVDVEHEVPAATREALEIVPCVTMADVLENAFEGGYRIDLPRHRARM